MASRENTAAGRNDTDPQPQLLGLGGVNSPQNKNNLMEKTGDFGLQLTSFANNPPGNILKEVGISSANLGSESRGLSNESPQFPNKVYRFDNDYSDSNLSRLNN